MPAPFHRLLLTGASGGLGRVLRPHLRNLCTSLRVTDLVQPPAEADDECVACDLGNRAAVHAICRDVDAIIHFGGVSVEDTFDRILHANIVGTFNLYEAARKLAIRRVVYASSGQVTGFYPTTQIVDPSMPARPSSLYGLSKSFGENLARLFHDRYGISTVCLRIAMCFPEPSTHRMLRSFLSYDDLKSLVERSLVADGAGFAIVYGVSANRDLLWRNPDAMAIGWAPKDSSERFRRAVESRTPMPDAEDVQNRFHGGRFTQDGPFEDRAGLAGSS
ncbi:MAG TPA: NAD(P)-dependent oxidoreductase [Casimicrobiaceae bacterium]|nr:NAD(P)-dependent oxidoreductase [Casimicrobiaceae bacterium]